MQRFDILMLSDLRLRGGVSTALVEQVKANASAGYTTGLINVWSAAGRPHRPADPRIRRLLDAGLLTWGDAHRPIEARLVIGLHPALFASLPAEPIDICGYQKLLLVTQPPFDGHGHANYDMRRLDGNAQEILGGDVMWAPVSPGVRTLLAGAAAPVPTLDEDWTGILNPGEWATSRDGQIARQPVIGRHGGLDQLKWPDTAAETLRAYPAGDDLKVRILGESASLRALLGEYPANWQVLPNSAASPPAFLKTIDHFVYFHHSRWIDGYGYAIIEAMASGAVPILPETFKAQFEGAAVYARPKDVARTVKTFRQSPARFRESSGAATALVRDRFSAAVHNKRVRDLIGPPRRAVSAVRRRSRRVMFLSSNGIGLGHLTRQLAIARRCSDTIEPVFVTMSPAVSVVRDFGFLCEHIPHYRHLRCDVGQWNKSLTRELAEMIAFYEVGALLFDGNVIYGGLAEALTGVPDVWRIWCRRAMWRKGTGAGSIAQEPVFDLVVEPGDIADQFDAGLTTGRRRRARRVDPIRLLDTNEQLSRDKGAARIVGAGRQDRRADPTWCRQQQAFVGCAGGRHRLSCRGWPRPCAVLGMANFGIVDLRRARFPAGRDQADQDLSGRSLSQCVRRDRQRSGVQLLS